ncbi:tetratricopeptide repeat protein [uncultured Winogradskyella sp.]|uniref:tetratricopeptide repeat protein n=1 Tax=uncultured Winogradskyella sp. TaxID=395353 RepID=UPI002610A38F|nr:tetratricopeptide repeat protein [uncultured Winogradskyella sp.]
MKKLFTLILSLVFATMSFAQKDEVKALEKALKKSNFADAKSAVTAADALIGNMDDKTKAKYYLLKAKALIGSGSDADVDNAIIALNKLTDLESKLGKLKYTAEATEIKKTALNAFLTKANNDINNKDYKAAALKFSKAYMMSPKDTAYLYYAASSAVNVQDYDLALENYLKLKNMNYSGVKMNYYATNVETGVEEAFSDKTTRDFAVKSKTYAKPIDKKSESKKAEIVKNIALIYVAQGKDEKALAAMADARSENPDDVGLILSEANVHLKMGNRDKFKNLMEEATRKDPNNAELFYNLGVLAAEGNNVTDAMKYYEKAIALNPNYVDAYNNLAVVILQGEAAIVEEMNGLGTSSADNRRYDELKEERSQIYKKAIPYLEKALELNTTNVDAARTLMNIYSALGETEMFKTMKSKVEAIESSAGGN